MRVSRLGWVLVPLLGAAACSGSTTGGALPDASAGDAGTLGGGGNDASTGGSSGFGGTAPSGGASGSGGSGGASTGGIGGSSGAAGGGGTGGTGIDPADQVCLTQATAGDCISCCSNQHASWTMVADATRQCECETPGPCKTACASSYCQAQPGDAGCYSCIFPTLAVGLPCYAAAKQACGADTDCNAYVECRAACTALPN